VWKAALHFHYSEFVTAPRIYLLRNLQTLHISIEEMFKKFTFRHFFIRADRDLKQKMSDISKDFLTSVREQLVRLHFIVFQ
jgi:hypothetical protein